MEFLKLRTGMVLLFAALIFTSCSKNAGSFSMNESVEGRVEQSLEWNRQHRSVTINVASDNYEIFCMGDSHVGTTRNLDRFFNTARKQEATAVLMAGDLCSGREEDYKALMQHIPFSDSLPVFAVTGNHDLHYAGWDTYFSDFGSSTYFFSVKSPADSDLYICLDTGDGTLGREQYYWLRNLLTSLRSSYRRCIAITHTNFFRHRQAESTSPLPEEIMALEELFTENHVDMVITGHDHRKDDRLFGVTRYIVMDPLEDKADNAGYFVLKISGGTINYEFVSIKD
ncbi:MAG TPA: metallophosphoesterase [Bacteroidales bacterium]|nr:metallophosphoesterase [Bacteroidales bacterium]